MDREQKTTEELEKELDELYPKANKNHGISIKGLWGMLLLGGIPLALGLTYSLFPLTICGASLATLGLTTSIFFRRKASKLYNEIEKIEDIIDEREEEYDDDLQTSSNKDLEDEKISDFVAVEELDYSLAEKTYSRNAVLKAYAKKMNNLHDLEQTKGPNNDNNVEL